MALTYLKNKVTGELKAIEAASEEYLELASKRIVGVEGVEDQPHRSLWEDRGVAGHAEVDAQPALGNINDRNYDDSLIGATPALGIDPDLVPVTGGERELHAKVADSGTTAEGSPDPNEQAETDKPKTKDTSDDSAQVGVGKTPASPAGASA